MTVVAVTTPTGNVGSHVVHRLVEAGLTPRVLLRDPERLDPGLRDRVDPRVGDLSDPTYLAAATAGADALYWVSPEDFAATDPLAELTSYAERLGEVVRRGEVPRVVLQSSVGAERRHGAGLIDGLARAEEELDAAADATGAAVLHLRCGYFFTNLLASLEEIRAGTLTTTQAADAAMPWVAPRDVAQVAAHALTGEAWSGRRVQAVHGPEDLTFADVAALLGEELGHDVRLVVRSDDEQREALVAAGMSEAAADGIVAMTAGLRDLTPEQPRDATTTTPTTLRSWVREHLLDEPDRTAT